MIDSNLNDIKEEISKVSKKYRDGSLCVELVAVSKTFPVEAIQQAYDAGQRVFGENKVQELVEKYDKLPNDCQWHLIGSLQTNKVKYIVDKVALIHSVDRVKLASEIQKQAEKKDLTVDVLLQVNTTNESTKSGVQPDEVRDLLRSVASFSNIRIKG